VKLIPQRDADVVHVRARAATRFRVLDFDNFVVETGHGIVAFFHYIRELWHRRALVRVLASRELKSTYEMNLVGFGWWVLEPLSMAAVYFVLINILSPGGKQDPTRFLAILVSLLAFKWLSQSLIGAMGVVRANSTLVTDVYFPRALLPLTELVTGLAHFGVGLLTVPVFMLLSGVGPAPALLWLPVVIAVQFLLMLGLAYPLSVWGLNYRNLPNLMGNILRLWFYLSPVLYGADTIASLHDKHPQIVGLMQLNPFFWILESYRDAIYYGQAPDFAALAVVLAGSIVLFVVGLLVFKHLEPAFAKVL
jgi:homopolymeric O-antigen transport system permease protein